jgi:predicted MFS family arabinose efflux permease
MKSSFTSLEKRAMLGLSLVLAARMLGFSLVLPMFSHYAIDTLGATRVQAGIAFGVYGLAQALLQIPFGTLSDRYGRKLLVTVGLVIFIVGSIVAAESTGIVGLTIGYFLQGAAAIASTILAWVADTIDVSRRNVGMAVLGASIGASIVFGLPLSPAIVRNFGPTAVFWACAALSGAALVIVWGFLHEPREHQVQEVPSESVRWTSLLKDGELMVLNAAGFLVYFTMRAIFFVIPFALKQLGVNELKMFLVIGLCGLVLMGGGARQSDKGRARAFIAFSFTLTLIGYLMMGFEGGWTGTVVGYGIWFTGFSVLQALLPGAVSKLSSAESRGTTLGLFNTCQYFGAAFGGAAAGYLSQSGLYGLLTGLTALVILGSLTLRRVDRGTIDEVSAPSE